MRTPKKRCAHCHKWFQPDPRTAKTQRFCPSPECRRQSRLESHRQWWQGNGSECNSNRRQKLRTWARKTNYYPTYRANNPDYVRRDNARRFRAHQAARDAAKQDMRREISVGMLRDIQALTDDDAAKQDMIHRRVTGILDFLFWKENAAKQDFNDLPASSA
jgi:hypothetical protein